MQNYRAIRRVLWLTMALNLIATASKLTVGYWTDSLSLIADGFDSVFDSVSNVIGLVGIYLAARPSDADHPYGHRKAETMTALSISTLLFLTTWELVKSAAARLRNPALIQAEVNLWSFGSLLLSIVVHLTVVWYELRAGRRLHSDILVADALHTRADIFVSLSVIGGLIAVRFGFPIVDPILAIVIALLIAKIGIDIIREGSPTLMDRVAVPPEQVERIVLSVPGVVRCHGVRSRGHATAVYVDMHIQVDPRMSTEQAHAIAHEAQYRLREQIPGIQDVTIHVEPAGSLVEREDREEVAIQIRELANQLEIGVHDVWIYDMGGVYRSEVHAELDGSLSLRQAHALSSALEQRARAEIPHLAEMTVHIEPHEQTARDATGDVQESDLVRIAQQVVTEGLGPGSCHHVQTRKSDTGWAVAMHCTLPGDISLNQAHRTVTRLETALQDRVPAVERVVIHAEPSTP